MWLVLVDVQFLFWCYRYKTHHTISRAYNAPYSNVILYLRFLTVTRIRWCRVITVICTVNRFRLCQWLHSTGEEDTTDICESETRARNKWYYDWRRLFRTELLLFSLGGHCDSHRFIFLINQHLRHTWDILLQCDVSQRGKYVIPHNLNFKFPHGEFRW